MDITPQSPQNQSRRLFVAGAVAGFALAAQPAAANTRDVPLNQTEELRAAIVSISENVTLLRSWWAMVEPILEQLAPEISGKAGAAFVNAALDARQLARAAGHQLRDYSGFDWSRNDAPADRVVDPFEERGVA